MWLILHIRHDWFLLLHFNVYISFVIIMMRFLALKSWTLRDILLGCWRLLLYRLIINQAKIFVVIVVRSLSIVVMVRLLLMNRDVRYLLNENLRVVVVIEWCMVVLTVGHSWSQRRRALIL